MKVIVAKNIGFCFGVKRAIAIAEKSLKEDSKPVQFLGSLVHNEKVIKKFRKKGVKFIKDLKEAKSGTLIIQAHGFPPFSEKINKKVLIRDATCPLVKKAQLIANSLFKKGYKVVIVGDIKHSETRGIKGYTENSALIVENERQVKAPPFLKKLQGKKIGLVAQTTQNREKFSQILKILKNKNNEVKWFDTICPEVSSRQQELFQISKKAKGILVIGSRSSANTQRLVDIAKKSKKPVWQINSLEELKNKRFKNISTLGVVSGTSAPNWEIKRIRKYLNYLK